MLKTLGCMFRSQALIRAIHPRPAYLEAMYHEIIISVPHGGRGAGALAKAPSRRCCCCCCCRLFGSCHALLGRLGLLLLLLLLVIPL